MGELSKLLGRFFDGDEDTVNTALERALLARNNVVSTHKGGAIYPSGLFNGCIRSMYFDMTHAPRNTVALAPTKRLIFDTGHYIHDQLQDTLKKHYGKRFQFEVPARSAKLCIRGRCDGVIDGKIGMDFKTINMDRIKMLRITDKRRRLCMPFIYDAYQLNIYIKLLDLSHGWIVYYNKNDSTRLEGKVMPNEKWWAEVEEKCKFVIRCVDKKEAPEYNIHRYCSECKFKDHCLELENAA